MSRFGQEHCICQLVPNVFFAKTYPLEQSAKFLNYFVIVIKAEVRSANTDSQDYLLQSQSLSENIELLNEPKPIRIELLLFCIENMEILNLHYG